MANFMVREQALYVWKARGKVGYLDTTPSNERALARYGTTGCTYRITSTNYPCRKDGHDFAPGDGRRQEGSLVEEHPERS